MDFAEMLREAREEEARKQAAKKLPSGSIKVVPKPKEVTKSADSMQLYCALDISLSPRSPIDSIDAYKVSDIPSAFLFQDWISEAEETSMLKLVNKAPPSAWVTLKTRRLQNWGGIVQEDMKREALPCWLEKLCGNLLSCGLFASRPNHVLINEYRPGQGILPHTDGPRYFPRVATLSLGSSAVMEFHKSHADTKNPHGHACSIFLPRRSLLLFTDALYSDYLHSIPAREVDCWDEKMILQPYSGAGLDSIRDRKNASWMRETRVSLTIRIV
jgi:alkylated DNA repair protein alkB family protein 6